MKYFLVQVMWKFGIFSENNELSEGSWCKLSQMKEQLSAVQAFCVLGRKLKLRLCEIAASLKATYSEALGMNGLHLLVQL